MINVSISINGDLLEVSEHIGKTFKLDADALWHYCIEAPNVYKIGDSIWPIGSVFPNEYRLLYGLSRILRPSHIVEAGTYCGCSATALLYGMDANQKGKLVSFDTMHDAGSRIPASLRDKWEFRCLDAAEGLKAYAPFSPIDFFFEDTQHTRESTRSIFAAALPHMRSGGLMMAHDPVSRPAVLEGLKDVGIIPEVYLLEGSNCGVTLWRKP